MNNIPQPNTALDDDETETMEVIMPDGSIELRDLPRPWREGDPEPPTHVDGIPFA